jgi:serine/threonine protein kinase
MSALLLCTRITLCTEMLSVLHEIKCVRTVFAYQINELLEVKLCDLGFSTLIAKSDNTILDSSPRYRAPEETHCLASDMYSLGIVQFEIATGLLAFKTVQLNRPEFPKVHHSPLKPHHPLRLSGYNVLCIFNQSSSSFILHSFNQTTINTTPT